MQKRIDQDNPTRLETSCEAVDPETGESRGVAFPPRRIVRVAKQLEERNSNGIVQSICQADFRPALDAITGKIADVLSGSCLPRELNPNSSGEVSCNVIEVLPQEGDFTKCSDIPGRLPVNCEPSAEDCSNVQPEYETDPETGERTSGEVCRVQQLAVDRNTSPPTVEDGAGWFYDDFSSEVKNKCGENQMDGQRISFTSGDEPRTGVLVRLECLQAVRSDDGEAQGGEGNSCQQGGTCTIGSFCNPMNDQACSNSPDFSNMLICDGNTNTCQLPCESDADCLEQNLGGFVCDLRPGDDDPDTTSRFSQPVCVNPTCGQ
jgi:hypothetical protein